MEHVLEPKQRMFYESRRLGDKGPIPVSGFDVYSTVSNVHELRQSVTWVV